MRLRLHALSLIFVAACGSAFSAASGGGGSDGGTLDGGAGDGCMSKTCGELGWECSLGGGLDPDGCGSMLDCGGCKEALSQCNSSHTCACQPLTCASSIYDNPACGVYPDGCGGTITCVEATCPDVDGGAQSCQQGKCVAGSCTKKTCGAGQCGPSQDGCGGILTCPGCASPDTCGGGGQTGMCGCDDSNPCTTLLLGCGTATNGCGHTFMCGNKPHQDPSAQKGCLPSTGSYYDCCSATVTGDGGSVGLGHDPVQPTCLSGPAPDPYPGWSCTVPGLSGNLGGSSSTSWCCTSAPGG